MPSSFTFVGSVVPVPAVKSIARDEKEGREGGKNAEECR